MSSQVVENVHGLSDLAPSRLFFDVLCIYFVFTNFLSRRVISNWCSGGVMLCFPTISARELENSVYG
jgi:hypothetical protein